MKSCVSAKQIMDRPRPRPRPRPPQRQRQRQTPNTTIISRLDPTWQAPQ